MWRRDPEALGWGPRVSIISAWCSNSHRIQTVSGQSGELPFPLLPCGSCTFRLKREEMSYKRKTMCQLIFIIQQSSFTTILLLVGTRGGERVSCQHSGWSRTGPAGWEGPAGSWVPGRQHCRVWREAVPAEAEPQNRVFKSAFKWRAQSTRGMWEIDK